MDSKEYKSYVKSHTQKSDELKTLSTSFFVGGIICCIGQLFFDLYTKLFSTFSTTKISALTSMTMIFIGAVLTGLGIYDKLGYFAGGGSIVPITGFANSIVAPAMEYKKEGIIFGVMSKMFAVAGPIIVSGILISTISGIIFYIIEVI